MTFDPSALPLPLEYKTQPNPPPRPKESDEAVRRAAAELAMPEIIDWLAEDWREDQREGYVCDLMSVLTLWDGYEAARALERKGWSPDAELVEILSDGCWTDKVVEDAVCAWVEANKITPQFAVGDIVKTPQGVGPITAIRSDMARYTVQTDQFLAKYPRYAGSTAGAAINFEDASAVDP